MNIPQQKVNYTYDYPSQAGPFKGSIIVKNCPKFSKGDDINAPFGNGTVTSSRTIKNKAFAVILHNPRPSTGFVVRELFDGHIPAPYKNEDIYRTYSSEKVAQKIADNLNNNTGGESQ